MCICMRVPALARQMERARLASNSASSVSKRGKSRSIKTYTPVAVETPCDNAERHAVHTKVRIRKARSQIITTDPDDAGTEHYERSV